MFSFGRKKTANDFVAEAKETYILPAQHGEPEEVSTPEEVEKPADPKMNANAHYTVGINEHGRTQFRMQLDYGSATLTMNDQGTIDLIEDLAHTIRKRYNITIEPIGASTEEGETT